MAGQAERALASAGRVAVDDAWFEVLALPNRVFSIHEPAHWQGVISFLILGSERAVLFDTGMGIRDISQVVYRLTDVDLMVVNSHTHFDHVGDNHRFQSVSVFDDDVAVDCLVRGQPNSDLGFDTRPDAFVGGYPQGFDPGQYEIRPVSRERIELLHDGDVIELGDRSLRVLHTPGHSPDSVMLLDSDSASLFTGDTFYPDWLFAFIDEPYDKSNTLVYERTLHKLARLVPELEYLYCSHTRPLVDPEALQDAAEAFSAVNQGLVRGEATELYGEELWLYQFDGFAIVTGKA